MTVLTNGKPLISRRGSVLSAFVPKPRPHAAVTQAPAKPRRSLRAWFQEHAGHVKDFLVAGAAAGCGDVAAFHWHPWAGWLALGLSLLFVDRAVDRDEEVVDERPR
jgi:hypothetical protein